MSWKRRMDVRSTFQFTVLQSELFRHLPPCLCVEEVVRTPFVVRCLLYQGHAGHLRYPHFLFHVITPFSTVPTSKRDEIPVLSRFPAETLTVHSQRQFEVRLRNCCRTWRIAGHLYTSLISRTLTYLCNQTENNATLLYLEGEFKFGEVAKILCLLWTWGKQQQSQWQLRFLLKSKKQLIFFSFSPIWHRRGVNKNETSYKNFSS